MYEAVKNNPENFSERYCFRISESKYSTSKGGSIYKWIY